MKTDLFRLEKYVFELRSTYSFYQIGLSKRLRQRRQSLGVESRNNKYEQSINSLSGPI